jgi:hypothetical protein
MPKFTVELDLPADVHEWLTTQYRPNKSMARKVEDMIFRGWNDTHKPDPPPRKPFIMEGPDGDDFAKTIVIENASGVLFQVHAEELIAGAARVGESGPAIDEVARYIVARWPSETPHFRNGAMRRVLATAHFQGEPITLDFAKSCFWPTD